MKEESLISGEGASILKYGWKHKKAGTEHQVNEMSFRQTLSATTTSSRGFGVRINHTDERVEIFFDASKVNDKNTAWLKQVEEKAGLGELYPVPYWGFQDLYHKAGTKLLNTFLVIADHKGSKKDEMFWYKTLHILQNFSLEGLLKAIEEGHMLIDFDARTGHNHGTKFRMNLGKLDELYEDCSIIDLL